MKCYHYCIEVFRLPTKKNGLFYYPKHIEDDSDYFKFLLFIQDKYAVPITDEAFIIHSLTLLNP